jgi:hypothetical protein
MSQVIRKTRLREVLSEAETNRSQKAQKIRLNLRDCRFPALSEAETVFQNRLDALGLRAGVTLVPPKNFENSTYTFMLDFKNDEELRKRFAALGRAIQNPLLQKIIKAP